VGDRGEGRYWTHNLSRPHVIRRVIRRAIRRAIRRVIALHTVAPGA
jgi:hypothetical protein